uniref:acid phosphatase n=1 Tax=Malurus cyaneus samueli TaxID=2593467 RepID=A0A8C5TA22_9PASS
MTLCPRSTYVNIPLNLKMWRTSYFEIISWLKFPCYFFSFHFIFNSLPFYFQFYIQSTDYDRTIMSAQSYLSGLFPPTSSQIWNPELLWQPIPVHTFQKSTEQKLHFPLPNCPRFDELEKETQTSKEFQNRIQPYMVRENRKKKQDVRRRKDIHNYTLPVWATKDVINKMEKLAELSLLSLFGIYKREEKSRLQGGVLVNIILNSIKQAVNSSNPRKMEVYSAHDTTIGAVQIALNIFNGKLPPYAACQFFELYQESNGQYSIEMHYRNDTSKDPYLLTLPGCTSSCPLEKFAELVSPVITENWAKECGKKDKMKGVNGIYAYFSLTPFSFTVCSSQIFLSDLMLLLSCCPFLTLHCSTSFIIMDTADAETITKTFKWEVKKQKREHLYIRKYLKLLISISLLWSN